MARSPHVAYVSLGCRTNRVETDVIASELRRLGCVPAGVAAHADAVVINTCAVTGEAEAKARKAVRRAASLPGVRVVVATGCVAALHADELARACPGVVVVADKARVAERVVALLAATGIGVAPPGTDVVPPPPGTPTGRTRPGVKIQDGCNLRCTYCVVWKARGPARSVPARDVIAAVTDEVEAGAREVVLTGINVGSYADGTVGDLAGLLRALLCETRVGRVRLSSIEPPDVTEDLLDVMAASGGRIAPFLHVCLQAGCDATLERMGRPYRTTSFAQVVGNARAAIPGISIGTDLIVGFPGESDADFDESYAFCRDQSFSRMHVFRFSARPGTPAATMAGQVDPHAVGSRAARMRDLAAGMRRAYAQGRVGCEELVVVQAQGRGVTGGLLDARIDEALSAGDLARTWARAVEGDVLVCDNARLEVLPPRL